MKSVTTCQPYFFKIHSSIIFQLTNTEEQLKRWQEHFSRILNRPVDQQVDKEEKEEEEEYELIQELTLEFQQW
jgi:hypothetical protein